MRFVLSYLPAPGDWGRQFRLYSIMIALGVIAALEMTWRRWQDRGGDPEDVTVVALWSVPAGLIGARLYHVITDHQQYTGNWFTSPFDPDRPSPWAIQKGGLGIPGGLLVGSLVAIWVLRRRKMRVGVGFDCVAPAVPLAQAIGRWGNYFNQELFGRPTTLPWGLRVDDDIAVQSGYPPGLAYHPTFLYEMLWNLGLMALLLWIDSKRVVRPGRLFLLYIFGYFTGRLWVEALRADSANTYFGLRTNIWTSLLAMAAIAVVLSVIGLKRRPGDNDEPYTDGHRWDPERGVIPADEVAAATAGGTSGDVDALVGHAVAPGGSPSSGSGGAATAPAPEPAGTTLVDGGDRPEGSGEEGPPPSSVAPAQAASREAAAGTDEPVGTEPVEPAEPGPAVEPEPEPAVTRPVEPEPVATEPVETEPVETEPVATEPVETGPAAEREGSSGETAGPVESGGSLTEQ